MKLCPFNFLVIWFAVISGGVITACRTAPSTASPTSTVSPELALDLARRSAAAVGGAAWELHGVSMRPFLSEAAIVVTEPAHFDELQPGDVVVYRDHRLRCTVHRLCDRRGDVWTVQGDNNTYPDDDRVTRGNYLGRQCVVFFHR